MSPIDDEEIIDPWQSTDDLIDKARSIALTKAIERMESGKASDTLLITVLKGILPENRVKQEVDEKRLGLIEIKTKNIESQISSEEMFQNAMKKFARYSGHRDDEDLDDVEELDDDF